MGAYIINVPDSVDRVVYINVDPMDGKTYIASYSVDNLTPYTEPDLEQVRKEAYAEGFKDGQYAERNGLVANYAQVHKIKIGDEVENTQTGVKFIVTNLWENNQGEQGVSGFNQECSAFSTTLSLVVKTGRTFPEIATVLEKMRGEQLRQAQRGIKHE